MPDADKCPLCGGKVLYRGFTAIECDSRREQCRNGTNASEQESYIAFYDQDGKEIGRQRITTGKLYTGKWFFTPVSV